MINLEHIRGRNALPLLEKYDGKNPYLKKLRNEYLKNQKIRLTEAQSNYILENHDKEPIYLNRVVAITTYLGEELQKKYSLTFVPEKILIEYLLADTEKTFHIYGKLKQNQKESGLYFIPKTQVIDDLYFEKIDVEVDFEKYDKILLEKVGWKTLPHQHTGVKFLLSRNGAILGDDMGVAKAQSLDSKILTPNGWTTMGELKVNDEIIGSDGKSIKVIGIFPQGKKDVYKITFTDGSFVESCDEHLWAVQTTNHKKRNNGFVVKELKDIKNDLTYGTKGNLKWYIPMVKPVEFNKQEIPIDPYVLGCLLGDGGFTTHNVIISSVDEEILECVDSKLPDGHYLKYKGQADYRINSSNNKNLILEELKKLNLHGLKSENKFVPKNYLYNTIDVRIAILQGLMDTDGCCTNNKRVKFNSTSKQLSDNVKELVESLGGVARQSSSRGSYNKNGVKIICKLSYNLIINLPENIKPFKLTRKLDKLEKNRKYLPSRGIKSVEYSRTVETQCIRVSAKNHLYVTDNYIVTHNTIQAVIATLESGEKKILIVCPEGMKITWERTLNLFTNDTVIIEGDKWKEAKFTIINYDILKNFHTLNENIEENVDPNRQLVNAKFDLVIIDEAHYLADPKSQRGATMVDLCVKHKIKKVWLLTGTAVTNYPKNYYNLLKLIRVPIVDNWKFYMTRYCEARQFFKKLKNGKVKKIWLTNGASNLDELALKTKNYILRRLKTEVTDMPEKTITNVFHKLSNKGLKEYENLWNEYLKERKKLKKKGGVDKDLVELILLRKFIAMQSIPHTIELTKNAIEQGEKVVIFTTFKDELKELEEAFGELCVTHHGSMTSKEKQESIDAFQNNPSIKIFLGNEKSAGTGITLTAGNTTIFNSFSWVTGENEQAEDRTWRLGQKNHCKIYYQVFLDTISIRMLETLKKKSDIITKIIGGKEEREVIELIMDYVLEETN